MGLTFQVLVTAMFFLQAGPESENPWADKVQPATLKAQRTRTIVAFRHALDVAYKADDWRAGLELARLAHAEYPDNAMLSGRLARAFWRAGKLERAERIVDKIDPDKIDKTSLTTYIEIQLGRGASKQAAAAAQRLELLGPETAVEIFHIMSARLIEQRLEGLPELLRRATDLIDPANGYPEIHLEEVLDGLPEFFDAIGPQPINRIASHGKAVMPLGKIIRLPYCEALINGQGPYRLIVDTGGSITLSLDDDIARELELKSYGTASIRGISGKQDSQQMLVDSLQIGEIACRRVMTRTFAMPELLTLAADGIIGTGIFGEARMVFDLEHESLVIAPSTDKSGAGEEFQVRIIGDAKVMASIKLENARAVALLDSGADVAALAPSVIKDLYPDRDFPSMSAAGLGVGEGVAAGVALTPGVNLECWGRKFDNYSGVSLDVLDNLLSPILGVQTQVLIGMPVLREMKSWTIDYPRRRMWLEWVE